MTLIGALTKANRNRASSVISQALPPLVNVLATPLLITRLGITGYGVWATALTAAYTLAALDGGIGASSARYLARCAHDTRYFTRTLVSVLAALTVAIVVVGGIFVVAAPSLASILSRENVGQITDFASLLRLLPITVWLMLTNGVLLAACQALGGFGRAAAAIAAGQFTLLAALLLLSHMSGEHPLQQIWASYSVAYAVSFIVLSGVLITKLWPARRGHGFFSWTEWREFASFGGRMQLTSFAALFNLQFDTLLVAVFVGPEAVALYAVATQVSMAIRNLPLWLLSPTNVALTATASREGEAVASRHLIHLQRRWTATLVIYASATLSTVPFIIPRWVGSQFNAAIGIAWLLSFGHLLNLGGAPLSTYLRAIGRPGVEMRAGLVSLGVNIGMTISLVSAMGVIGVALGTALGQMVAVTYLVASTVHMRPELRSAFVVPGSRTLWCSFSVIGGAIAGNLLLLLGITAMNLESPFAAFPTAMLCLLLILWGYRRVQNPKAIA